MKNSLRTWNIFCTIRPIGILIVYDLDLSKSPDYLFDLIDKYQLNRDIRTGIALPILNGGNQYISLDHYKEAGKYFVSVATQAAERGITLSMDCGFIACMFTTQQIGKLLRLGTGSIFCAELPWT